VLEDTHFDDASDPRTLDQLRIDRPFLLFIDADRCRRRSGDDGACRLSHIDPPAAGYSRI
jgi:hypothetical protein